MIAGRKPAESVVKDEQYGRFDPFCTIKTSFKGSFNVYLHS